MDDRGRRNWKEEGSWIKNQASHLPLQLIPGAQFDQSLRGVQIVLGAHEEAEDVPPRLCVHPHLPGQLEQLVAVLVLSLLLGKV